MNTLDHMEKDVYASDIGSASAEIREGNSGLSNEQIADMLDGAAKRIFELLDEIEPDRSFRKVDSNG